MIANSVFIFILRHPSSCGAHDAAAGAQWLSCNNSPGHPSSLRGRCVACPAETRSCGLADCCKWTFSGPNQASAVKRSSALFSRTAKLGLLKLVPVTTPKEDSFASLKAPNKLTFRVAVTETMLKSVFVSDIRANQHSIFKMIFYHIYYVSIFFLIKLTILFCIKS